MCDERVPGASTAQPALPVTVTKDHLDQFLDQIEGTVAGTAVKKPSATRKRAGRTQRALSTVMTFSEVVFICGF